MARLQARAVSDVGAYRTGNQDSAFTAHWGAAVADGVGGGPAGDLASAALVHRLVAAVQDAGSWGAVTAEQLLTGIRVANWDLRAHVLQDPALEGMATTFTGLFTAPADQLVLTHTGDSRAYLLRAGEMTRETRDDSYVQSLIDRGLMTDHEAFSHPHRNVITASLHGRDDDVITLAVVDAIAGDRWLLCSDGVTDYLREEDVAVLLTSGSPADSADAIVRVALAAGSRDNVTAVVCDVTDAADAGSHSADDVHPAFYGAAADRFNERLDRA